MLRATRHYKERTNSTGKQQPNEHQRQPNNTSHYGAVILQQPNRQQLRHPNISSAHIQRVMALVMLLTYSSAVFAFQKQIQKATCEGVVLFPSSKDWTCKAYYKKTEWNTSNIDGIASFLDTAVNSLVKRTNA